METKLRIILAIIAIPVIILWKNRPYEIVKEYSIYERANISTYPLGRMDGRTMESMYRLAYGIFATAYQKGCYEKAVDAVLAWSHEQNDVTGCIHLGCEQALMRATQIIEKVLEFPDDFKFSCNPEFDYHQLPTTLANNDYVDCDSLIKTIDELLEVNDG